MVEIVKSALSYSWAMSLFGVRQLLNGVIPDDYGKQADRARADLYSVTQTTEDQFNDLIWAAFQVGDDLQKNVVDLAFDIFALRAFAPSYLATLLSDMVRQSQQTLRVITPGASSRLALEEFRNNYEVYNLVKHPPLKIPAGPDFPLAQLVEQAYRLGVYPDLWAVEGLGHDYAATFWGKSAPIRNMLTDEKARVLPGKSLTMMHAGMGLLFAQQLMGTVTPFSPAPRIIEVLSEFVTLCKENSREGYIGAAYESLGLVTRTWHSQMVPIVDKHMMEVEPDAVSYFWHGAGRALYFLPVFFVPGLASAWRAAEREAPHEAGKLNMIAGLTWATTIVNIRQPRIMENFLKYQGEDLLDNPAFSNGVMSVIMMAQDINPEDAYIREFLRYAPDRSDPHIVDLWNTLVGRPANDAAKHYYPVLKAHNRLGDLFHYQDISAVVRRLESTGDQGGRGGA